MLTDAKLLTQLQTEGNASYESLFLRHYDRIYIILFKLLGNQADAEDNAQQVFIKLYHHQQRLNLADDQENIIGWLYRVATNIGYNTLRSQKRRQNWYQKFAQVWPFELPTNDPAQLVASADAQTQVRQILAQMKPRDAKLLLLRHSGLSYKELAVTLNLAPSSIGSLLTRAERSFAKKYKLAFRD